METEAVVICVKFRSPDSVCAAEKEASEFFQTLIEKQLTLPPYQWTLTLSVTEEILLDTLGTASYGHDNNLKGTFSTAISRARSRGWRRTFVNRCPRYCLGNTQFLLQDTWQTVEKKEDPKDNERVELELAHLKLQLKQQAQEKKKIELELECSKLQLEQQAQEKKRLELELEGRKLQLERQAHQMQSQEDRLSKIVLILKNTDKILASLGSRQAENGFMESIQLQERGPCYWIFDKYHSGIKYAFMSSLVELAHQFARAEVISSTMEKYVVENETIPCERKADELMKAVQFALDRSPENFWKVVNILKTSENPVCKRLSDGLERDCHLSNAVDLHGK